MINRTYILLFFKKNRGFLLFSSLFVSLLFFLIIWLLTIFDVPTIYSTMLTFLPQKFQSFITDQFVKSFTLNGAIAFAFNHPIILILFSLNAILLASNHISKELSEGTLELLLSFPIQRTTLLLSLWISIVLQLLVMIIVALLFSSIAIIIYHTFSLVLFINMIKLSVNLWIFFIFISTITIVFNVFGSSVNNTGIRSAGFLLIFYLLHFIISLWEGISFLKPFNFFSYYEPNKVMFGQASLTENVLVLGGLTIIFLIIGLKKFKNRDIP